MDFFGQIMGELSGKGETLTVCVRVLFYLFFINFLFQCVSQCDCVREKEVRARQGKE